MSVDHNFVGFRGARSLTLGLDAPVSNTLTLGFRLGSGDGKINGADGNDASSGFQCAGIYGSTKLGGANLDQVLLRGFVDFGNTRRVANSLSPLGINTFDQGISGDFIVLQISVSSCSLRTKLNAPRHLCLGMPTSSLMRPTPKGHFRARL